MIAWNEKKDGDHLEVHEITRAARASHAPFTGRRHESPLRTVARGSLEGLSAPDTVHLKRLSDAKTRARSSLGAMQICVSKPQSANAQLWLR